MRSSPTRTFSPSDLCLEAGCIVHQQASPGRGGGGVCVGCRAVRMMAAHNALPQAIPSLEPPKPSAPNSPIATNSLSHCSPLLPLNPLPRVLHAFPSLSIHTPDFSKVPITTQVSPSKLQTAPKPPLLPPGHSRAHPRSSAGLLRPRSLPALSHHTLLPPAPAPVASSCSPTSKASLSVMEREVVRQLRY